MYCLLTFSDVTSFNSQWDSHSDPHDTGQTPRPVLRELWVCLRFSNSLLKIVLYSDNRDRVYQFKRHVFCFPTRANMACRSVSAIPVDCCVTLGESLPLCRWSLMPLQAVCIFDLCQMSCRGNWIFRVACHNSFLKVWNTSSWTMFKELGSWAAP